jgi:hypothetical protein
MMQKTKFRRDQLAARAKTRAKHFQEDCRWDHIFFSPKVREQVVRIQSVARGGRARQVVRAIREAELRLGDVERQWEEKLNWAASRMQAILRRHHVRKTAAYSNNPLLVIAAALRIQRWVRRFIAERMRLRILRKIVVAQGVCRRWRAWRVVQVMQVRASCKAEREHAATRLQAANRSKQGRRAVQLQRILQRELKATIVIQAALRKRGALQVFRAKREEKAATRVQAHARRALAQKQFRRMVAMAKAMDRTMDPQKFVLEFKCQDAKHSAIRVSVSGAITRQQQEEELLRQQQQQHGAGTTAAKARHQYLGLR